MAERIEASFLYAVFGFGKGKVMKRNDWIFIAAVLLLAGLAFGVHFLRPQQGGMVEVLVDGKEFGSWPLSEDAEIPIGKTNLLCIKDGQADMTWADCPDKLCVHQKAISRDGESIICLPNKVVVSIIGGEEREIDGVA